MGPRLQAHLTISQGLNHVIRRMVEKGRFAMVILKKETGVFASACENLLSLISTAALPEEDRIAVEYYLREIEQRLDLSYPLEKSC